MFLVLILDLKKQDVIKEILVEIILVVVGNESFVVVVLKEKWKGVVVGNEIKICGNKKVMLEDVKKVVFYYKCMLFISFGLVLSNLGLNCWIDVLLKLMCIGFEFICFIQQEKFIILGRLWM